MPKIKTSKTASKRIVRITKNGKIMRASMSAQHLARRKSKRSRGNAMNNLVLNLRDVKKIKKLLPNG